MPTKPTDIESKLSGQEKEIVHLKKAMVAMSRQIQQLMVKLNRETHTQTQLRNEIEQLTRIIRKNS